MQKLNFSRNGMAVTIFGIAALAALEITAMLCGEDGQYLLPIVAAIGFLCGLPVSISGVNDAKATAK